MVVVVMDRITTLVLEEPLEPLTQVVVVVVVDMIAGVVEMVLQAALAL